MNHHTATAPLPRHTADAPQAVRPDHRVLCPDCGGTEYVIEGHPNDPNAPEVPCSHCDHGTIDLDEAHDRGLL